MAGPLVFHLKELGIDAENDTFTQDIVQTLQPRSRTLVEMAQGAAFYYKDEVEWDQAAADKFLTPDILSVLEKSAERIEALVPYTQEALETAFKLILEETGLKFGKIAQPLRVAVTGTTVSPGIFEMLLALGKEKTLARIKRAVRFIQDKA